MPPSAGTDDPLALIQYLDLKTYLVGDINTKVDRASMAHSLEVREPLMDHPLVEWLATLPTSLKIRARKASTCFKKAMEPHLPARHPVPAEDGLLGAAGALVPRPAEAARARRRAG
jgi:asparagine synthetase B (glutamine-hydrolysing)